MKFKLAVILVLSLSSVYGRDENNQRDILRTNIAEEMTRCHIPPEAYLVARANDDHLFVVLTDNTSNDIEEAIHSWPSAWEKDPKFLVLLYHHHIRRLNSWRTKSSPSLHITRTEFKAYSIDIDLHAPSFKHPVESVKHLKEIVSHMVTGKKSDQRRISVLLARNPNR